MHKEASACKKSTYKITPPVEFMKRVGPYTYPLDYGKKCHASRLVPVKADVMDNGLITNAEKVIPSPVPLSGNSVSSDTCPREKRQR